MQSIISSEIFIITLVSGVYLVALWLYRKTKIALLHPLLVSIPVLLGLMNVLGMEYETFRQGSRMINFLLGPSVVALSLIHICGQMNRTFQIFYPVGDGFIREVFPFTVQIHDGKQ